MAKFCIFAGLLSLCLLLVDCKNDNKMLQFQKLTRLPRSNTKSNNEEFEKFFLKASKSVPRIGRRGFVNENFYGTNAGLYGANKYQYLKAPFIGNNQKRISNKNLGAPFWANIAHLYEYNPDLPDILESLSNNVDQEQGDDPTVYDFSKFKIKKGNNFPTYERQNKESLEYRIQPEV